MGRTEFHFQFRKKREKKKITKSDFFFVHLREKTKTRELYAISHTASLYGSYNIFHSFLSSLENLCLISLSLTLRRGGGEKETKKQKPTATLINDD